MTHVTHEVLNQSTPFVDVNLFETDTGLHDALRFNRPGFDAARFSALGAEVGSAQMVAHARLANHHAPVLRSRDRFDHRIDEVAFHPSYHALLGSAVRHGLHGTPWSMPAGSHVERAAAFFDTFYASRLASGLGGGGAFGLLDARVPLDELIARATPGIR